MLLLNQIFFTFNLVLLLQTAAAWQWKSHQNWSSHFRNKPKQTDSQNFFKYFFYESTVYTFAFSRKLLIWKLQLNNIMLLIFTDLKFNVRIEWRILFTPNWSIEIHIIIIKSLLESTTGHINTLCDIYLRHNIHNQSV